MITRPHTEHADQILGSWWQAGDEQEGLPADLSRRAEAMTTLSERLVAYSKDGQVGAEKLLSYGEGALAEVISGAWSDYFAGMAEPAAKAAAAAAALTAWATTMGAWLADAAEIVWRTEGLIDAARLKAAATGTDPQPDIDGLIEEARAEVAARGAATMSANAAALPAWAGPPMLTQLPGGGGRGVLPAPANATPEPGRGVLPPPQEDSPTQQAGRGILPAPDGAAEAAADEPGRGILPTPQSGPTSSANVAGTGSTPASPPTAGTGGPATPAGVASPSSSPAPATTAAPAASVTSSAGTPAGSAVPAQQAAPAPASGPTALPPATPPGPTAAPSPAAEATGSNPHRGPADHGEAPASPSVAAAVAPPAAPPAPAPPTPAGAVPPTPAAPAAPPAPLAPPAVSASPVTPLHSSSSIAPPPISKPVVAQSDLVQVSAEAAAGGGVVAMNGPGMVVQSSGESDLDRLRRILRAIGGGELVAYAAAVLVSDGRRQVVLTSDRGRGWMPPGSVVPAEAGSPWDHPDSETWEGLHDPARALREYAAAENVEIAALVATRGALPAGVPAEHVEAGRRAHPELLRGEVSTRVQWQAAELAATIQEWPRADDSHRQAMSCAWLAHEHAPDPDGLRGAVLAAVFDRARQGVQAPEHRTAAAPWKPLTERWTRLGFEEVRARVDPAAVAVGDLDGRGAAATRPLLATLYADEAALALMRPGAEALEAALYSAAMLGVGRP